MINPGRFKDRVDPSADPLGDPPDWMDADQRRAWQTFGAEIPWLNASHRGLLEIASLIRARLMQGEMPGVQALNLLRQCYGQMGATPADASKVNAGKSEDEDPDEQFFCRPN